MILSEIEELYSSYITKAEKVMQNMKPSDGLFGIGKKASDDPCHDEFADSLEKLLTDYENTAPASEEVREVLRYIYNEPVKHEDNKNIYWMMNAVHGLTQGLIRFMSADDASVIWLEYKENYPKSKRLPVQKQIEKLLEKTAKK